MYSLSVLYGDIDSACIYSKNTPVYIYIIPIGIAPSCVNDFGIRKDGHKERVLFFIWLWRFPKKFQYLCIKYVWDKIGIMLNYRNHYWDRMEELSAGQVLQDLRATPVNQALLVFKARGDSPAKREKGVIQDSLDLKVIV